MGLLSVPLRLLRLTAMLRGRLLRLLHRALILLILLLILLLRGALTLLRIIRLLVLRLRGALILRLLILRLVLRLRGALTLLRIIRLLTVSLLLGIALLTVSRIMPLSLIGLDSIAAVLLLIRIPVSWVCLRLRVPRIICGSTLLGTRRLGRLLCSGRTRSRLKRILFLLRLSPYALAADQRPAENQLGDGIDDGRPVESILLRALFPMLFLLLIQRIRKEDECDHQTADQNGHIEPRRLLNIAGHLTKHRHAKHHLADNIAGRDKRRVHIFVGVALCAIAHDQRIILIRYHLNDAVRSDHARSHAERNDVVDAQFAGVHRLDIDERSDRIRRFHRTREHAENVKPKDSHAGNQKCKQDGKHHHDGGQSFEHFDQLSIHRKPPVAKSERAAVSFFGTAAVKHYLFVSLLRSIARAIPEKSRSAAYSTRELLSPVFGSRIGET